jgi:uncharacterized membrane protein
MTEKITKMPNGRQIVLPVSIVLNLFLIALIGGHMWHDHSIRAGSGSPIDRALALAEARLPSKDAAAFGAVIRRDAPQYTDAVQKLMVARREIDRKMAEEQFDRDGMRADLVAWRAAWNQFFDDFTGTIIDAVAQISPEGRRDLVVEHQSARPGTLAP